MTTRTRFSTFVENFNPNLFNLFTLKFKTMNMVTFNIDENSKIDLTINLKLSDQNFYHLEDALSRHCDWQKQELNKFPDGSIEKRNGQIIYDDLISFIERLRDELRKEFNLKYNDTKEWV